MAATVLDLLTQPELLAAAQEDWATRMQGLTYKCPLPEELEPPLDQLD